MGCTGTISKTPEVPLCMIDLTYLLRRVERGAQRWSCRRGVPMFGRGVVEAGRATLAMGEDWRSLDLCG